MSPPCGCRHHISPFTFLKLYRYNEQLVFKTYCYGKCFFILHLNDIRLTQRLIHCHKKAMYNLNHMIQKDQFVFSETYKVLNCTYL